MLSEFSGVEEAAVIVRKTASGEKGLVAYVVPGEDPADACEWRDDHVDQWKRLYEATYGGLLDEAPADDAVTDGDTAEASGIDFNITGWNSSFTGRAIPETEMQEWVDNTVDRILSLNPDKVLEIGCGTGLLLSRIAPICSEYRATDFSGAALDHVRRILETHSLSDRVRLSRQTADNFEGLAPGQFDLVILNSVVQYFPDVAYMLRVMEGAAKVVRPGGVIFVGDVRDFSLLSTFHTAVQVHQAGDSVNLAALRPQIERKIAHENELLLSPCFLLN